jgi:hypothetical protein
MMSSPEAQPAVQPFTVMRRASHSLHECRNAEEFRTQFVSSTGEALEESVGRVVSSGAPHAAYLVGSLPLGMATSGSDIDIIVLLDDREAIVGQGASVANTERSLAFSNDTDPLRVGEFLSMVNGILVDITAAIALSISRVHTRLRGRGPELSESEIMILGRLRTGWLLWETPDYLAQRRLKLTDTALDVYCSTRSYVSALHLLQKSRKALDLGDISLTLQLGRSAVEDAYLAYFASEGFCYLGPKWLAQIGHAQGAAKRLQDHPMLGEAVHLLFPTFPASVDSTRDYLRAVEQFLAALKKVIEQKTLFRIAFGTCPQIEAL